MKKIITLSLIAVILLGSGAYWYLTRDRREVERLLNDMIRICGKASADVPHRGILKYTAIDKIFSEPVRIYSEHPAFDRNLDYAAQRSMLLFLHRSVKMLNIEPGAIDIEISGELANFSFDAEIDTLYNGNVRREEVVAVKGQAWKKDGKWKISELAVELVIK